MYEESFVLPSKGLLNSEIIEGKITIRNITTEEEKKMYAATSFDVFNKVLDSCIVEPKGLSMEKLVASDKMYIFLRLRAHTYGPEYIVHTQCTNPDCLEKSEKVVNLLEFPVTYLPEEFEEPITTTLPRSKDVLELRFLRGQDVTKAEQLAKAFTRRFKQPFKEAEYVYRMCLHTVSVNGTVFENITDAYEYF